MHTFEGKKTRIFYSSDLSGDVIVVVSKETTLEMEVPGQDLLDFVAEHVRQQRITQLEDMTTEALLGLPTRRDTQPAT